MKEREVKEFYIAPSVELLGLTAPISLLVESFSGTGSVGDFEDSGEELWEP